MGTASKKHHYVPQNHLKKFCKDKNKNDIFVFDKKFEKVYLSTIKNAGSENHFNTVRGEQSNFNFEDAFQNIDARLSEILPRIIESESIQILSKDEVTNLMFAIAAQFLRVKMQRTTQQTLIKDTNDFAIKAAKKAYGYDLKPQKEPDDEEAKFITINRLLKIDELVYSLLKKDIFLYKNISEDEVWISDNPVAMSNHFPYGHTGFNRLGIQIFYPISSKFILGLICKSIKKDPSHPKNIGLRIRHLCETKGTLPIQDISWFNHLQICNSSRFIYSGDDNFEFAKKIISQNPELKEIKQDLTIGGDKKNYRMPKGEFLVVYLSDNSFMIPVSEVKQDNGLQFKSDSIDLFLANVNGKQIKRVELYKDQQTGFCNAEMNIKEVNRNTKTIVLEYKNEDLNAILKLVNKHIIK